MHIAQEDLFMEEAMGEAYTRLRLAAHPVALSEKQLDGYREEIKAGTLEAPMPMPGNLAARRTGTGRRTDGNCISRQLDEKGFKHDL